MKEKILLRKYNYYKKDYSKYLLLIKKKDKFITYDLDAKIVAFLFKIHYVEEIWLDKNLLDELLILKEIYHFNIAIVVSSKIREYYCQKNNNYIKIKNKSKKYVKELECVCSGEK